MGSGTNWTVACATCGLRWNRGSQPSEYERQAVESRPCPGCGAYTLTCREVKHTLPRPRLRRAA